MKVFCICPPHALPRAGTLASPLPDGFVLRGHWGKICPAPGVWDWSYFDGMIAQIQPRRFSLQVQAGIQAPAWLRTIGASYYTSATGSTYPLPWDRNAMTLWLEFVYAFGERYANTPGLDHVTITGGLNSNTEEWFLDRGTDVSATWRNVYGYNKDLMHLAGLLEFGAYASAFPLVPFNGYILPNAWPSVSPHADWKYDDTLTQELVDQAQVVTGRFHPTNAGFTSYWRKPGLSWYQTAWGVTGDLLYRMNAPSSVPPVPDSAVNIFRKVADSAIAAGMQYLEVYPIDMMNADLTPDIQRLQLAS